MGQSYGKFNVPHANTKGDKAATMVEPEAEKHTNGDIVNGNVVMTDIPPITEPDTANEESGEVPEEPEPQPNEHHNNTLMKKCKKRAASLKAKTLNFLNSPAKEGTETVTTTDENNNVEVAAPTSEESVAETETTEQTKTPSKAKKSKSSFRNLMKRASSNLSKKHKDTAVESVVVVTDEEPKTVADEEEAKPVETTEVVEEKVEQEETKACEQIVQEIVDAVEQQQGDAPPQMNGNHTEEESVDLDEQDAITSKMANLKVDGDNLAQACS